MGLLVDAFGSNCLSNYLLSNPFDLWLLCSYTVCAGHMLLLFAQCSNLGSSYPCLKMSTKVMREVLGPSATSFLFAVTLHESLRVEMLVDHT